MALTTKRETKKAKKQAKKTAAAAGSTQQQAEKALIELQKLAATIGPVVSEGAREARSRGKGLVDQYLPTVEDKLRHQGDKIAGLTATVGPRADKFMHDVQDDYYPRARRTASTTNNVLRAAIDAARAELDKGQADIRAAVLTPTPQKKGSAGKVLLVLGLAAAGAAAGYVAWQKTRPVEDPWAPPADFARAHYPASASTETDSSTVSDTVGSADAGDVAQSLKGEDRSSDVEPKTVKVESDLDASKTNGEVDGEKRGNHRGDA